MMSHVLSCALLRAVALTSLAAQAAPAQLANVTVSRRELRVVFARDTAKTWGWSDRKDLSYRPTYMWAINVDGMDGPRILVATVGSAGETRDFPSLERLVAAGTAQLCRPGMMWQCEPSPIRAGVEQGHVVLTLSDSAQIARLFGMRPSAVQAWQRTPQDGDRTSQDSAVVKYIPPLIPVPDAATREDAARSRRQYEASITSISRYITGGESWQPLWLEVGDSAVVAVDEMICHYDACSGGRAPLDSGWTISDTSIARLQPVKPDTSGDIVIIYGGASRHHIKALRAGRTMLVVRGIYGGSDTAPSEKPPERKLEREVIVTAPIERLEVQPRLETVRRGEIVKMTVRAVDNEGHEVMGLPWRLEVLDGKTRGIHIGPELAPIAFTTPGRVRLVARLGVHTDTMTVMVTPGLN